jgi:hypothetical protein
MNPTAMARLSNPLRRCPSGRAILLLAASEQASGNRETLRTIGAAAPYRAAGLRRTELGIVS